MDARKNNGGSRANSGTKGYGEMLEIVKKYSALSDDYFRTLTEWLNGDDKELKKLAMQLLSAAFTKMIPQKLDGEFNNRNLNANIECTPEEHNQVKQALIASIQNTGSPE